MVHTPPHTLQGPLCHLSQDPRGFALTGNINRGKKVASTPALKKRRITFSSEEDSDDIDCGISPIKKIPWGLVKDTIEDSTEDSEDSMDSGKEFILEAEQMSETDTESEECSQVIIEQSTNSDTEDDTGSSEETPNIFPITSAQRVAPNKVIWARKPLRRPVLQQAITSDEDLRILQQAIAANEARAARLPSDFLTLLMDERSCSLH